MTDDNSKINNSEDGETHRQSLEDIIRNAEFPDDYDLFEDSMLDMIP